MSSETSSSGAGGTISIDTGALTIREGASVSARTFGLDATGRAGRIEITADSVDLSARSDISAGAWRSQGDAGAIEIDVRDRLRVDAAEDYAFIWTTSGQFWIEVPDLPGAPGRIDVEAGSVELVNGGTIQSSCYACTSKAGSRPSDAATVRIVADSIVVEGSNQFNSSFASTETAAAGDAGSVEISTGSLELRAGGYISTQTGSGSSGNAGVVRVQADSVLIHEPAPKGTGIFVRSGGALGEPAPTGDAGEVYIDTGSLVIEGQGTIAADTVGEGRGGSVVIRADSVQIGTQGVIHAGSSGTGEAGTIDVTASESILLDGSGDLRFSLLGIAQLLRFGGRPGITGIFSAGGSGSITLAAPDITLTDGALVLAITVGGGDAGDVFLSGDRIYVRNGALVDSTSFVFQGRQGGNVGNITLEATELIEVSGSRAGVQERPLGVLKPFEDVSRVTSANLSEGEGGTVELRAPRILIDGGAVATTALAHPNGWQGVSAGNISVSAGELIVRGGGRIDASSFIPVPGGNIDITASDSIVVEGKASDGIASGISSRTGADGDGGAVTLRAPLIEVSEDGEISAKSEADPNLEEEVGRIFDSLIDDTVWIGIGSSRLPTEATGNAGSVTLAADKLRLSGGTIATNAEAADGGSVTIEAKDLVHLDAGVITAAVRDGTGGNITIDPEVVILEHGSRIVADAGTGSGGNIQITADNYFAFPGSVVDASSDLGIDGIVEVSTPDVDLAGTLTALPASYLDAASLMRERCAARRSGERAGSFAVRGNGGIPAEPDGWLPGTVSFEVAPGPSATSNLPAGPGGAVLFAVGSCW